jgi:hypothetical protein
MMAGTSSPTFTWQVADVWKLAGWETRQAQGAVGFVGFFN